MGQASSIQSTINNIVNETRLKLEQDAETSASATCNIKINTISFIRTNGCSLTVSNSCSAKADLQLTAIINATTNFYNNLDNSQKQNAPAWLTSTFGISSTINNVTNVFEEQMKQRCSSEASVNQNIDINNIKINECSAPTGQIVKFEFINTGTAQGMCAMKFVTDLIVSAANDITNKQEQGIDWNKLIWPVIIGIIVCVISYVVVVLVVKKIPSAQNKIDLEIIKQDNYVNRIKNLIELKNL